MNEANCLLGYILKNKVRVEPAPAVRRTYYDIVESSDFDNFIFIIKWVDALGSNNVVKICEIL